MALEATSAFLLHFSLVWRIHVPSTAAMRLLLLTVWNTGIDSVTRKRGRARGAPERPKKKSGCQDTTRRPRTPPWTPPVPCYYYELGTTMNRRRNPPRRGGLSR